MPVKFWQSIVRFWFFLSYLITTELKQQEARIIPVEPSIWPHVANNLLKCFAILQQCAPPPRQALFNGILLWASSFECHVWKCAAHTHYTKMEVITKSPTLLSIQSVLLNLPEGGTFKPPILLS